MKLLILQGHLKLINLKVQISLEQLRAIQSIEKIVAFMEPENESVVNSPRCWILSQTI
jgi:hypothetical protein